MRLPLQGRTITEARFDGYYSFFISTDGGYLVRLGGELELATPEATYVLDADLSTDGPHLDRLRILEGREILQAEAQEEGPEIGTLRLCCAGDVVATAPALAHYESWELSGTGGALVVAMPGGELAIWDPWPQSPTRPDTSRPAGVRPGWRARALRDGHGVAWQRPGAVGDRDSVQIVDPDDDARYPYGFVRFYNHHNQAVDLDGAPASQDRTHIARRDDGTYPAPEGW